MCYTSCDMNAHELMERVEKISSEESFSFYENGERIGTRFNLTDRYDRYNEGSFETRFSFSLYGLVSHLVLFKAQGTEASRKGMDQVRRFFQKIVSSCKDDAILDNLKAEQSKALSLYEAFLSNAEKVTMVELFAKSYPLLAVALSTKDGIVQKKEFQSLSKKKETLFRQASLFLRSLFQSFLTMKDIDPQEIRMDSENLTSPFFAYKNTLVLSTDRDSFSLALLKEDIENNLKLIPKNFSLKDIDSIAVIYLLRSLLAVTRLD